MAAQSVMSQVGGVVVATSSFHKDSGDKLDSSSQSCFVGSPQSMTVLRRASVPREAAPSSVRPVSASLGSMLPVSGSFTSSMLPGNSFRLPGFSKNDVTIDIGDDNEEEDILSTSSELLDTVNNIISDVVDGQKYLKETGRTKPRPMKRRSLIACLAMGTLQPYLSDVEKRMTSLGRTTSNSLAKTVALVSQLSVGASRQLSMTARQISFTARQMSFGPAEAEHLMPAAA